MKLKIYAESLNGPELGIYTEDGKTKVFDIIVSGRSINDIEALANEVVNAYNSTLKV